MRFAHLLDPSSLPLRILSCKYRWYLILNNRSDSQPSPGLTIPKNPIDVLSADIDPAVARGNASQLVPHALLAFKSPSPPPAWVEPGFEGRLAYLVCTEDEAIPKIGQEAMMQGTAMSWNVNEIKGSHMSPFLKDMEEAAEAVGAFVEQFLGLGA